MPDTSRSARYVLKDYVNAKLLYCHPPPGISPDNFNVETRERALAVIAAENRKRAPTTRVGKKSDAFVKTQQIMNAAANGAIFEDPTVDEEGNPIDLADKPDAEKPHVWSSISARADNRPALGLTQISKGLDKMFFREDNVQLEAKLGAPRTKGATSRIEGETGFTRPRHYNVHNLIDDTGKEVTKLGNQTRMVELGTDERRENGKAAKKHFKPKRAKQRSGAGYD